MADHPGGNRLGWATVRLQAGAGRRGRALQDPEEVPGGREQGVQGPAGHPLQGPEVHGRRDLRGAEGSVLRYGQGPRGRRREVHHLDAPELRHQRGDNDGRARKRVLHGPGPRQERDAPVCFS